MKPFRSLALRLMFILPLVLTCCKAPTARLGPAEPVPADLEPTFIDYSETDAFDALFETALVNRDPAIVIRTEYRKPEWGPHLNAWIAAWNEGGKGTGLRKARSQSPVNVTVNAESIREFRLLVESLMDRVEGLAEKGSAWWAEERTRANRVALLRPYNLRFHMDPAGNIQLVFFDGTHAQHYARFVATVVRPDQNEPAEWVRTYSCSICTEAAPEPGRPGLPSFTGKKTPAPH